MRLCKKKNVIFLSTIILEAWLKLDFYFFYFNLRFTIYILYFLFFSDDFFRRISRQRLSKEHSLLIYFRNSGTRRSRNSWCTYFHVFTFLFKIWHKFLLLRILIFIFIFIFLMSVLYLLFVIIFVSFSNDAYL